MVRQFMKNKRGQNTAEYALLIALVVGGVIAMQTYAQRALQARVRDASVFMATNTNAIGTTKSYEPIATLSDETTETNSVETKRQATGTVASDSRNVRTKLAGAFQNQTYNAQTAGTGDVPTGL